MGDMLWGMLLRPIMFHLPVLLLLLSVVLVGSAFVLEHAFGAEPCRMCWWQRYGHWAMLVFAGLAVVWQRPQVLHTLSMMGVLCAVIFGLGIGLWQSGAEFGLWGLPAFCTGGEMDLSADPLLALTQPLSPACDDVNFRIFGGSLATWNVLMMVLTLPWVVIYLVRHR